jgi:hypothetical protein
LDILSRLDIPSHTILLNSRCLELRLPRHLEIGFIKIFFVSGSLRERLSLTMVQPSSKQWIIFQGNINSIIFEIVDMILKPMEESNDPISMSINSSSKLLMETRSNGL